jgi:hypothetical protein
VEGAIPSRAACAEDRARAITRQVAAFTMDRGRAR